MDTRLHGLIQYCQLYNITEIQSLQDGPDDIQLLLRDHSLRPHILKYLLWKRNQVVHGSSTQIRDYADEEELEQMNLCHQRSIELLKSFLGSITPRSMLRALDVAGGDGRLAKSLLVNSYAKVDLFDQCPKAVSLAKADLGSLPANGFVEQATM